MKAISVFSGVKVLTILCSLIRNKLVAIWIGPVGVGMTVIYNSALDLIGVTARLNIEQSSVREISAATAEVAKARVARVILSWSKALGILAMLITMALSPLLSQWGFGDTAHWKWFFMLSAVPLFTTIALGYQSVMQGSGKLDRLAAANTWTVIGGTVVSVPLIWFLRLESIPWIILTYAVSGWVASYIFRVRCAHVQLGVAEIWRAGTGFVRLGMFITMGLIMANLTNYLFVLYLKNFADADTLGVYQAGATILNTYLSIIFTGVWVEMFPRLGANIHSRRRTQTTVAHHIAMLCWLTLPIMLLFMACARPLVRIVYANSFLDVVPFITTGICALALRASSWCMALVILARADGKLYIVTEAISNGLCLVLNIVFWNLWGFRGLGIAYILWYGAYVVSMLYVYKRIYGYRLPGGAMAPVWVGTGAAFTALAAYLLVGWWLPLLMGIAAIPVAYRYIFRSKETVKS